MSRPPSSPREESATAEFKPPQGASAFPACRQARRARSPASPGLLAWLASEPFRVFFPLGALASVAGVLLWPLFYAEYLWFHPGLAHARVMIECSLGAYIFGFLGTAVPRMLEAPRVRPGEAIVLIGLWAASFVLHLSARPAAGDALFLLLALVFCAFMIGRWARGDATALPSGFWTAAAGMCCGVAGAAILLSGTRFPLSLFGRRTGELLLYQGFPLLPLLGIGGFLFPRFFPNPEGWAGTKTQEQVSSLRSHVLAFALALGVLASFALEAAGWERAGNALRFALAAGFLVGFTRAFRRTKTPGTLAFALRCGLFCLLAGLAAQAVWAGQRIAVEHALMLGGFGLVVLTVSCRVVLGHAGRAELFFNKLRPLQWMTAFVLLAMATRVSADFLPRSLVSHHNYAALLWALAALLWLAWLSSSLARRDPDPD